MERWFADNFSEAAPIRGPMLVIAARMITPSIT